MSDDWASDTEEGFGDFAAPEVSLPDPPPKPAPAAPPANAWAASSDARLATRLRHEAAHHRPHPRALAPQDPRRQSPSPRHAGPAPGFPSPRFNNAGPPAPIPQITTTLFVSRVPSNTHEGEIASFFARCGVSRNDVSLVRYPDTGNVKAALVTTRGEPNRDAALAMSGTKLVGRPIQVKIERETVPAAQFVPPRRQPPTPLSAPPGPTTSLYVFHLPSETSEHEIANLFRHCGVTIADVRLMHHNDTGNIKGALVNVRGDANRLAGLALDGAKLGGRPVHVKIDGDRRGGAAPRERSGYGFASKERRMDDIPSTGTHSSPRDSAWSSGWTERSGPGAFDPSPRGERGREGRGANVSRGSVANIRGPSDQRDDPTIPTGPPPAGRKKLVLKPRTKPPPVLEVDTRAIDGVKSSKSSSMSQPRNRFENSESSKNFPTRQQPGPRIAASPISPDEKRGPKVSTSNPAERVKWNTSRDSTPKEQGDRWSSAKEGAPLRTPAPTQSSNKKDDDSKKRPVLLNNFAALEINDAEA